MAGFEAALRGPVARRRCPTSWPRPWPGSQGGSVLLGLRRGTPEAVDEALRVLGRREGRPGPAAPVRPGPRRGRPAPGRPGPPAAWPTGRPTPRSRPGPWRPCGGTTTPRSPRRSSEPSPAMTEDVRAEALGAAGQPARLGPPAGRGGRRRAGSTPRRSRAEVVRRLRAAATTGSRPWSASTGARPGRRPGRAPGRDRPPGRRGPGRPRRPAEGRADLRPEVRGLPRPVRPGGQGRARPDDLQARRPRRDAPERRQPRRRDPRGLRRLRRRHPRRPDPGRASWSTRTPASSSSASARRPGRRRSAATRSRRWPPRGPRSCPRGCSTGWPTARSATCSPTSAATSRRSDSRGPSRTPGCPSPSWRADRGRVGVAGVCGTPQPRRSAQPDGHDPGLRSTADPSHPSSREIPAPGAGA